MNIFKKGIFLGFMLSQGLLVQNVYGYITQQASRERQAQLIASGKLRAPGVRPVTRPIPPVRPALKDLAPRESLAVTVDDSQARQQWLNDLLSEPTTPVKRPKKDFKVRKPSGRIALENMIQNNNSMLIAFNAGGDAMQRWLDQALKTLLGERNPVLSKSNVDFVRKHLEEATRDELEYSFNAHPGSVPKAEQMNLLNDMKGEIDTFIKSRL